MLGIGDIAKRWAGAKPTPAAAAPPEAVAEKALGLPQAGSQPPESTPTRRFRLPNPFNRGHTAMIEKIDAKLADINKERSDLREQHRAAATAFAAGEDSAEQRMQMLAGQIAHLDSNTEALQHSRDEHAQTIADERAAREAEERQKAEAEERATVEALYRDYSAGVEKMDAGFDAIVEGRNEARTAIQALSKIVPTRHAKALARPIYQISVSADYRLAPISKLPNLPAKDHKGKDRCAHFAPTLASILPQQQPQPLPQDHEEVESDAS